MTTLNVNGKEVPVDEEGYLLNLSDWDEDVARYSRKKEPDLQSGSSARKAAFR